MPTLQFFAGFHTADVLLMCQWLKALQGAACTNPAGADTSARSCVRSLDWSGVAHWLY